MYVPYKNAHVRTVYTRLHTYRTNAQDNTHPAERTTRGGGNKRETLTLDVNKAGDDS